ncbi:GDNF family receptor alpha-like [Pelodytes ibericus]
MLQLQSCTLPKGFQSCLLLCLLNWTVSQATDCYQLKEICKNAKNECGRVWNITENVCDLSEKNCQVNDLLSCNTTIHYFIKKYPEFKGCVCSDDIRCSVKRLLGKQCHFKNGTWPTLPGIPILLQPHPKVQPLHPWAQAVSEKAASPASSKVRLAECNSENLFAAGGSVLLPNGMVSLEEVGHGDVGGGVMQFSACSYKLVPCALPDTIHALTQQIAALAYMVICNMQEHQQALHTQVQALHADPQAGVLTPVPVVAPPAEDHVIPTEPVNSASSFLQKNYLQHSEIIGVNSVGKVNDCNLAKQSCKENQNCFILYEKFRRTCANEQCIIPGGKQRCLSAWNDLKATILWNCVCLNPKKEKCVKIWNIINNNSCLLHSKERKTSTYMHVNNEQHTDSHSTSYNIKLEWETSSLAKIEYRGPMNCFNVTTRCLGDTVCNRYLAALMKACSDPGKVCNVNDCHRTIQAFYDKMPFNISQILAFCYCAPSDINCHNAEKVLHSKSCTIHTDAPISCLSVIDSCLEDDECRKRYEMYEEKCWKQIAKCQHDERCLLALDPEDMTCSRNDDCRAAYISIFGTQLQMQCMCNTRQHTNEQHLCHLFSHMLHSESCLEKVTARNIHASYIDTQEKQLVITVPHTFHNGLIIYIVAYTSGIILVSGIILLALLQTRTCRAQAKRNLPKGNVSESLMNSQS